MDNILALRALGEAIQSSLIRTTALPPQMCSDVLLRNTSRIVSIAAFAQKSKAEPPRPLWIPLVDSEE